MKRLLIKNRIQEKLLFNRRMIISIMIVGLLSIALLSRLFYLQINQHQLYTTLSNKNIISLIPIPPKRGLIYDRNGVLLANNIPVFSLMVTPSKTKNLNAEIKKIKKIIPITTIDMKTFKKQSYEHRPFAEIPLKIKLTSKQVAIFDVNSYQFPGFKVKANLIRQYPLGETMAHVVGYVGRINAKELASVNPSNYADTNYIGKTGIEAYYEKELHGTVGYKRVEVDSTGQVVRTISITPPVSGDNLYLSIDAKLQAAARNALHGFRGAIIAVQPSTGQVLAMVSEPSFNPNLFVNGISEKQYKKLVDNKHRPLFNRTVRGLYPIGSTIKPFIGLEGLDSNVITPQFEIFDPGWFKLPNTKHIFHNWQRSGFGWVNLHKAIVLSDDTYFYNLAYMLGIKPIDTILYEFGFGQNTGIDTLGELPGTVPSPQYKRLATGQRWFTGDTVNTAIGQGYSLSTPLQLAMATAALSMHGARFKPYLMISLQPPGKSKIEHQPTQEPPAVLNNPKNWSVIVKAMENVIPHGTGFRFGKTPYTVAAKTGTAQVRDDNGFVVNPNKLPINQRPDSLFIAFAPVNNPKIAIAVIVEHHPGASPVVARKVLDYYLLTEKHWTHP